MEIMKVNNEININIYVPFTRFQQLINATRALTFFQQYHIVKGEGNSQKKFLPTIWAPNTMPAEICLIRPIIRAKIYARPILRAKNYDRPIIREAASP